MRAIAFAVILVGLDRKLPKDEYHSADFVINATLQLVCLIGFFYCIFEGI